MPNRTKATKTATEIRIVLGRNIGALMALKYVKDRNQPLALANDAGTSRSTIQRVIKGEIGISVDTLSNIARALDVVPYQLLVRHLDPDNPQVVISADSREREQYRRFRKPEPQPQ